MKIIRIAQNASNIELNGSTLTVYHRTKNQDVASSICSLGFMAGGGAAYGRGIYTTYDIKSSLKNYNLTTYGGELLKGEVDVNGFVILDYDIAKRVYGANYRLTDQINNVIGRDKVINNSLDKKAQWSDIENISRQLNTQRWTSDIASRMSHKYGLDRSGVSGILYTGRSDGHVCLAYKEMLVTPIAHAWIDGKTYKNPTWTDCGQRSIDELRKLTDDENKTHKFRNSRLNLLNRLDSVSDKGKINLDPADYPYIPQGIFEETLANFLYEDEDRIQRLSPQLRTQLKDIIEIEFLIKKLKSAPTVYWQEWQNVDQSVKDRIPKELLLDIWEKFIVKNPGYWSKIPDDIRPAIPKETEAKHWAALVKKNEGNWKHVHPEIVEYMRDVMNIPTPKYIDRDDATIERISETEEVLVVPKYGMNSL